MPKLLFVCWGNICRSPMAERVARRVAAERDLDVEISSFGLSAEELHQPIDRRAARTLSAAGYDAAGHRARRITEADILGADLVVAAEPYQVERLRELAPGATNLRLLNDYNRNLASGTPLQDPWYGDEDGFLDTLADVEAAVPGVLDELVGTPSK